MNRFIHLNQLIDYVRYSRRPHTRLQIIFCIYWLHFLNIYVKSTKNCNNVQCIRTCVKLSWLPFHLLQYCPYHWSRNSFMKPVLRMISFVYLIGLSKLTTNYIVHFLSEIVSGTLFEQTQPHVLVKRPILLGQNQ